MNTEIQEPTLTLSSLDVDRIEQLLEKAEFQSMPGVDMLTRELRRAKIVDPEEIPPTVVTMNSRVRFREQDTGETREMTLVYPRDAGRPGCVSIFAPVGSALLGLSVGDRISWTGPRNRVLQLQIEEVVYQPEASGEWHR